MTYNKLQNKTHNSLISLLLIITWSTLQNDTLVTFYERYKTYYLVKLQVNLETVLVDKR